MSKTMNLLRCLVVVIIFVAIGCDKAPRTSLHKQADMVDSLVIKGRAAGITNLDSLKDAQKQLAATLLAKLNPKNVRRDDYYAVARLYSRADKLDSAVLFLEKIPDLSQTVQSYDLLFEMYLQSERIEDAEWLFNSKIKPLNPEGLENYYESLYYGYADLDKKPLALVLTENAIAALDKNKGSEFAILKAELLFHKGKTDIALALLRRLKEEFHDNEMIGRRVEAKWNCLNLLGKTAPEFAAQSWLGCEPVKLQDLRGKVIILDFWAPWCGPCRAIMPHISKLYNTYHNDGLEVIGITRFYGRFNQLGQNLTDLKPEDELQWLEKFKTHHNIPFPYAVADEVNGQRNALIFGVSGVPHVILIDKKGILRYYAIGSGKASEQTIENAVTELLKESAF